MYPYLDTYKAPCCLYLDDPRYLWYPQVSCGARHSAVATIHGKALCCGCNSHGEAGHDVSQVAVTEFTSLRERIVRLHGDGSKLRVKDIECGWWHTAILAVTDKE